MKQAPVTQNLDAVKALLKAQAVKPVNEKGLAAEEVRHITETNAADSLDIANLLLSRQAAARATADRRTVAHSVNCPAVRGSGPCTCSGDVVILPERK